MFLLSLIGILMWSQVHVPELIPTIKQVYARKYTTTNVLLFLPNFIIAHFRQLSEFEFDLC